MARGIGGDDGPSLFMFIAVVLIWGKLQNWWQDTKNDFSGNLANVVQTESTDDIRRKEAAVKAVKYRVSTLPHDLTYYQSIADDQYRELLSWFNVDEDKLIDQLRDLNVDELKAVYKAFGVRDNKVAGVAQSTLNLIEFYKGCFEDGMFSNELTNMRAIWTKTGLWA